MDPDVKNPDRYDAMHRGFRWHVPARFNIGEACGARWARDTPDAVAIRYEHEDGTRLRVTYGQLQRQAERAANLLRTLGVQRGDRVAIVMPQRIETAVAHLAVYRIGAIAIRSAVEEVIAKRGDSLETQRAARRSAQRQELVDLLAACGGNVAEMARRLSLTRGAVVYRLQKHGLMV